jgi:hypothetical protein
MRVYISEKSPYRVEFVMDGAPRHVIKDTEHSVASTGLPSIEPLLGHFAVIADNPAIIEQLRDVHKLELVREGDDQASPY